MVQNNNETGMTRALGNFARALEYEGLVAGGDRLGQIPVPGLRRGYAQRLHHRLGARCR